MAIDFDRIFREEMERATREMEEGEEGKGGREEKGVDNGGEKEKEKEEERGCLRNEDDERKAAIDRERGVCGVSWHQGHSPGRRMAADCFQYFEDFLTESEEEALLTAIYTSPWVHLKVSASALL